MSLARMAIYGKGVEIYIAPTADPREEWVNTMRHIALEGRCFVLGCNQYMKKSMYPEKCQSLVTEDMGEFCPGGSVIVSPLGKIIEGPLFGKPGALMAALDLEEIAQAKLDFDVNGHYSRDDIFELSVRNQHDIKQE